MSYNKLSGVQDVLTNTDVGGCMFTDRKRPDKRSARVEKRVLGHRLIKAIKQQILLFEVNYELYRKHYHLGLKHMNISVSDFC